MLLLIVAASLALPSGNEACVAGIDHNAFVKSQTLDCATMDMDRADAALNARYRAVMPRLDPARRKRLRLEERRWIDQRRARCLAAGREMIPAPEINRMLCLVRETDARTIYLTRFR